MPQRAQEGTKRGNQRTFLRLFVFFVAVHSSAPKSFCHQSFCPSGIDSLTTQHASWPPNSPATRYACPPRASCMEQSWNNVRAKSLRFSAFALKYCSIDLEFFILCRPLRLQKTYHRRQSPCRFS